MSSRTLYRSASGCCICGTKSSSSRFLSSDRYSEHYSSCFGTRAADRSGQMCNACVLYVKRWLKTGHLGQFSKVLDSKVGPGPKHMTQIAKLQRQRLTRAGAAMATSLGSTSSGIRAIICGPATRRSVQSNNRNNILPSPMDHDDDSIAESGDTRLSIATSTPSTVSGLSLSSGGSGGSSLTRTSSACSEFRAPSQGSTPYKRRVQLAPVRTPDPEQVEQLFREIMEKNSEVVDFDCRLIHMAMQNQLRRRLRSQRGTGGTSCGYSDAGSSAANF